MLKDFKSLRFRVTLVYIESIPRKCTSLWWRNQFIPIRLTRSSSVDCSSSVDKYDILCDTVLYKCICYFQLLFFFNSFFSIDCQEPLSISNWKPMPHQHYLSVISRSMISIEPWSAQLVWTFSLCISPDG